MFPFELALSGSLTTTVPWLRTNADTLAVSMAEPLAVATAGMAWVPISRSTQRLNQILSFTRRVRAGGGAATRTGTPARPDTAPASAHTPPVPI